MVVPRGVYQVDGVVRYAGAAVARRFRVVADSGETALTAARALAHAQHLTWVGLTGLAFLQEVDS